MKRLLLTLLLALSIGVGAAWAETYTVTPTSSSWSSNPSTATLVDATSKVAASWALTADYIQSDATWTVTTDTSNGNRGVQFGSAKKSLKNLNISTSDIQGTITKVVVETCGASSANITFGVKVGETAFKSGNVETVKIAAGSSIGTYTFEGSANGVINLSWSQTTSKAIYLKSIKVEYTPTPVGPETVTPIFSDLTVNYDEFVTPVVTEPADFFEKAWNVTYKLAYNEAVVDGEKVLEIDGSDILAACAGEATITVSWEESENYYKGSTTFNVTVKELEPSLSYTSTACAIVLGDDYELPTLDKQGFKDLVINYSSSDEEVAMVESNGTVVLMDGTGSTTITAEIVASEGHYKGAKASYTLTVSPAGTLAAPSFSVAAGDVAYGTEVSISAAKGDIYFAKGDADAVKYEAPFALDAIGEVTYSAYAQTEFGKSEATNVTYNVVPATAEFEFNATAGEIMMGSLLDIDALLNNPKKLNYSLSTDAVDVARVALNDPKRIWLMAPGVVTITATPVETDTHTAAATTYSLTVKEEVGEPVETTATFDFTKAGAYGMEAQSGNSSTYNETRTEPSKTYTHENGEVQFITSSKVSGSNFSGTRLWGTKEPYEYRVTSNLTITISASGYTLNSVTYVSGTSTNDAVLSDDKTSATISSGSSTLKISSIIVNYTKPGADAEHCYAGLDMGEDREALAFGETLVDPATMANDADALVEYMVIDENEAEADEVMAEAKDGQLEITSTVGTKADYTLVAYIDPYNEANGKYYAQVVEVPLYVREAITPAELYIHGHFCDRYYDLTNPVKMVKNGKVFTANDILIGYNEATADKAYDFVFSTHKLDLAEAPEQSMMRAAAAAGSHQWEALTEGFVYHAPSGNVLTATPAAQITEAADLTPIDGKAGFYQFTVDFSENAAAPKYVAEFTGDVTTGVEGVVVESAADAVYYDLTGRRVLNPSTGIVIRVQGGKAEKIMLK